MKTRIAVLISGSGSNMQSLAHACRGADFPAKVELVISNNPKAKGIGIADAMGLKTCVINHREFEQRKEFEQQLDIKLRNSRIELVCLAGFMRVLSPFFVQKWQGRLLNIHPSLLPKFRGLNTHEQALKAKEKIHGCTVHEVVNELDSGPILGQAEVPVLPEDTPASLAQRVLAAEHKLYPQVLREFCANL